jgi:deoxyribonuclease-1
MKFISNQNLIFLFVALIFCLALGFSIHSENENNKTTVITDFQKAKKFLRRIYKNIGTEFYCGCEFIPDETKHGRFQILKDKCGLETRTGSDRSYLIEWEHIVPAYNFGKERACWKKEDCEWKGNRLRGRKCCSAIDPGFREIEADLHNLVPAPGEINNDRGHYNFGIIDGEKREYGKCDFEVDFKNSTAEPREAIRGDIARIYLYMELQWGVPIPEDTKKLYQSWNEKDPADAFEIRRNEVIERIQGRKNPFIP